MKGQSSEAEHWLQKAIAVAASKRRNCSNFAALSASAGCCAPIAVRPFARTPGAGLRLVRRGRSAPDLTEARILLATTHGSQIPTITSDSSPTSRTN